jgi:hypothetical protein
MIRGVEKGGSGPKEGKMALSTTSIGRVQRGSAPALALAAFLGLVGATASTARGAAIRYEYGGTITSAAPSTGVTPGNRFAGTFTYDPNANVPNPTIYAGLKPNPTTSAMNFSAGNKLVFSQQFGVRVSVVQSAPFSSGSAHVPGQTKLTIANLDPLGNSPVSVNLNMANPTKAVFSSFQPPLPLHLYDYTSATLSVTNSAKQPLYSGVVDTLKLVPIPLTLPPGPFPVPEPAALMAWLGLSGAASLWLARARRRAA